MRIYLTSALKKRSFYNLKLDEGNRNEDFFSFTNPWKMLIDLKNQSFFTLIFCQTLVMLSVEKACLIY